jgi:hypothetical protein
MIMNIKKFIKKHGYGVFIWRLLMVLPLISSAILIALSGLIWCGVLWLAGLRDEAYGYWRTFFVHLN